MNKWIEFVIFIFAIFIFALMIIQSIVIAVKEIGKKPPEKMDIAIRAETENTKERLITISDDFKKVAIPVMHLKQMLSEKSELRPKIERWLNDLGAMLIELSRIHAEIDAPDGGINAVLEKNQKQDEKKLITWLKKNQPVLDTIEVSLTQIKNEMSQEEEKIDKKHKRGKTINFTAGLVRSAVLFYKR